MQLDVPPVLYPALKTLVDTFVAKSADYSDSDEEWDSNFGTTARQFDMTRYEACDFNELQKLARLRALRRRKRPPTNESVEDTYRDKMNYAVYAYALYLAIENPERVQAIFDASDLETNRDILDRP